MSGRVTSNKNLLVEDSIDKSMGTIHWLRSKTEWGIERLRIGVAEYVRGLTPAFVARLRYQSSLAWFSDSPNCELEPFVTPLVFAV